jgi:hypothetical protein
LPPDPGQGRAETVLGGRRAAAGFLLSRVPGDYGGTMNWTAELQIVWIVNGRRVPGRVAIGVPELVPDGDGEAICGVALDGLQRVTSIHGQGVFHALMQAVRFLDVQLRDFVAKGVRAVLLEDADPGGVEDPERDTANLLAMFKPFD